MTDIIGIPMSYNIPSVQPVTETQKEIPDIEPQSSRYEDSQQQDNGRRSEIKRTYTDLNELSLTFNKEESFAYIGGESHLSDLDVQKAVSDMRKDKIFEEYQYFVGGKPDLQYDEDIDGTVVLK